MMQPTRKSQRLINRRRLEQPVADLPICIISEILKRVPAELILSSRCVCKGWYKLTKESTFIRKHFEWSKEHEPSRYLLQANDEFLFLLDINEKKTTKVPFNRMTFPMTTYPYTYNLPAYCIVSSCNGLLCLRPKALLDNVIICNPITKKWLMLPTSIVSPFVPWKSYQLGFHFDSSSGKYKVIREFQFLDNQPSQFEFLTVGETSWKELVSPNCLVEPGFDEAVFWNGGFHWKLSETDSANGSSNFGILRFDLMEEKFSTIRAPFTTNNEFSRYRLIGLRGELKIAEYHRSNYLRIWKVKGNTIEGFSVSLESSYCFWMPPNKSVQHYDVISEIDEQIYLMQVNTWVEGINKSKLEVFYPELTPTYLESLDVEALPHLFKIISYKPSLLPPLA